jgi:hypothetical protein
MEMVEIVPSLFVCDLSDFLFLGNFDEILLLGEFGSHADNLTPYTFVPYVFIYLHQRRTLSLSPQQGAFFC